jgi:hypothetical protein
MPKHPKCPRKASYEEDLRCVPHPAILCLRKDAGNLLNTKPWLSKPSNLSGPASGGVPRGAL